MQAAETFTAPVKVSTAGILVISVPPHTLGRAHKSQFRSDSCAVVTAPVAPPTPHKHSCCCDRAGGGADESRRAFLYSLSWLDIDDGGKVLGLG